MDDPMDRLSFSYTPGQISFEDEIKMAFLYSPHATGRALKKLVNSGDNACLGLDWFPGECSLLHLKLNALLREVARSAAPCGKTVSAAVSTDAVAVTNAAA